MKKPKILMYDIETFPNIGYSWGKWEQNIIKFVKEWELASFAYRWLGETKVHCISRKNHTEKQLVKKLYALFNQADATVAHNGDQFDLKKSKTKFLQFIGRPQAMTKSIDTKKIAKSQFAFNSNSLNDLAEFLGLGKKVDTGGFDLWLACMAGDKAAWARMEKYNKKDVVLLEKVYMKLRPWAPNHPNLMALYTEDNVCVVCGSKQLQSRGSYPTKRGRQHRVNCHDCGKWDTRTKALS